MLFGQLEGVFQPVTCWGIFQVVKIKQVWAANKEVFVEVNFLLLGILFFHILFNVS